VDEPVDRAEVLPQRLDQPWNLVDPGQIKRDEAERSVMVAFSVLHRRLELGRLFPRNGDRPVSSSGEPAHDAQA